MKFISIFVSFLALFHLSQAQIRRSIITWHGLADYYISLGARTVGDPFHGWSEDELNTLCSSVSEAPVFKTMIREDDASEGPELELDFNTNSEHRTQRTRVIIKAGEPAQRHVMECSLPPYDKLFYLGKGRNVNSYFLFAKRNHDLILHAAVELNFNYSITDEAYPLTTPPDVWMESQENFCNMTPLDLIQLCASIHLSWPEQHSPYILDIIGPSTGYCRDKFVHNLGFPLKTIVFYILDSQLEPVEYNITPHPLNQHDVFLWILMHADNCGILRHLVRNPQ